MTMSTLVVCVSIYPGVYIGSHSSPLPVKLKCNIHYSIRVSFLIRLALWILHRCVERARWMTIVVFICVYGGSCHWCSHGYYYCHISMNDVLMIEQLV